MNWRKSSYCGNSYACAEAMAVDVFMNCPRTHIPEIPCPCRTVVVRDSGNPRYVLTIGAVNWGRFLADVKAGKHDLPERP